ncbi:hypothetical protein JCM33374_g2043 [Metschnikowia sp. JCM 33374]|nr:hypothetical protein JCM33374_g2043 [Metschnikowia sp. JCM 33374]
MSWNTAKKRFQIDLARYPQYLRPVIKAQRPSPSLPTFNHDRFVAKNEIKSTLEQVGIAPGDLAYVTEGRTQGQGVFCGAKQTSYVVEIPKEFPANHIKLAAKDRDEQGNVSYVVADEVVHKDKYYDPNHYRWLPRRFVKHHENIEIPWPKPPVESEADSLSTDQEAVFNKTYELQTIARSPLPKGVLAELRNPYSRYKKKTLTDLQARRLNAPSMPLSKEQQIYLAKKAQTPAKKLEPLSEEAQEFIGSRIAEHLAKVEHPALWTHLEAVSSAKDSGYAKTMRDIEAQKEKDEHSS